MKKIHILTSRIDSPNGISFLFPLIKFEKNLHDLGFNFCFFLNHDDKNLFYCDYLIIDCRYAYYFSDDRKNRFLEFMQKNKKNVKKLIFYDNSDSSGTIFNEFLNLCDVYFKNQMLKETNKYTEPLYGGRIYTDYYNKKYNVKDKDNFFSQKLKKKDILKIKTAWNSCFNDWSFIGGYKQKLICKLGFIKSLKLLNFSNFNNKPNMDRIKKVSLRIRLNYSRNTISYHRKILSQKINIDLKKLSRYEYFKEMERSKVIISPFGFGEISLRDYEGFLAGGILLKPSVKHMITWPNFYKENKTVMYTDWDFKNLSSILDLIADNYEKYIQIAQNGQNNFLKYTYNWSAGNLFAKRFQFLFKSI